MIRRYWAEEPPPVPSIRYVDEGEQLRGTAGALRLAREQGVLDESFFVIYGDSFLPVEFAPVWRAFQASDQPALMTVLRNEGRWDRSNVIYQPGRVVLYDKQALRRACSTSTTGFPAFAAISSTTRTPSDLGRLLPRAEPRRPARGLSSPRALL